MITLKGLSEQVSRILPATHKLQLKVTLSILLSNIMVAHINLLQTSVKRGIACEEVRTKVVPIKDRFALHIG